jgi:cobyrinic acid a,c-diamide synthase
LAKAFVVAAPASGSGKTMITLGLLRALKNKGIRVASAKVGPDYIDPQFHEAATGVPSINLDPWAMPKEMTAALLHEIDAEVIVIEGVMGLFDGPQNARGSTADLAEDLNLPIILVLDASHQAQSIAALAQGFINFRKGLSFAGIILNKVASDRHAELLVGALKPTGVPVLGIMRRNDSLNWPSRHLGLVQAQENQQLETFTESAASTVTRETNLDNLLTIGTVFRIESSNQAILPPLGQNVAVAKDEAFSFVYPHILQSWKKSGAQLSFFSPLANESPDPEADAIFLPGGYPELHAGRIAQNQTFLTALRKSTALIYGECGGYMVLGDAIIDGEGRSHAMAGLLPLTTSFATRKLHLGYRQLTPLDGPWKTPLRGHEFHYSTIASEGKADKLFNARDAAGNDLGAMGMKRDNVMGSYAHIICEAP